MPNWCNNEVLVVGEGTEVGNFGCRAGILEVNENSFTIQNDPMFNIANFVPEPNYDEVEVEPYFISIARKNLGDKLAEEALEKWKNDKVDTDNTRTGWWDWRIANWGIKWDIGNVHNVRFEEIEEYTNDDLLLVSLNFTFTSPWGPPMEGLETLSGYYPTLLFIIQYSEPGCDFAGEAVYNNGKTLSDDSRTCTPELNHMAEYYVGQDWDEVAERFATAKTVLQEKEMLHRTVQALVELAEEEE